WALYEDGALHPDSELHGDFAEDTRPANVDELMENIKAVLAEEAERLERLRDTD
ncbi:MAG: serine protein kinase RIO, partial [Gammaproteobacteria bacterium]